MTNKIVNIEIEKEQVINLLSEVESRTRNLQPAMGLISLIVKRSIVQNFNSEGRPKPWKPSQRVLKEGGKTLSDTSILKTSFQETSTPLSAEVSTTIEYAAIHNFGGTINRKARQSNLFFKQFKSGKRKGKTLFSKESKASFGKQVQSRAYTIKMPQREFMMVQEEDWENIRDKISNYLLTL